MGVHHIAVVQSDLLQNLKEQDGTELRTNKGNRKDTNGRVFREEKSRGSSLRFQGNWEENAAKKSMERNSHHHSSHFPLHSHLSLSLLGK